ncbi:YjbE family putative metal transport protein (plasmid) [Azospirillum oryzae]|uniref:YjbE family putative metal transport protein n=1 Tax=Azospirillum oryzae TaxID=286727 RepID=A0A6N1AEL4_9PROT|nr:YjbE family putative metal transport protein [Azospirillum oryzae]KAA0588620.1 YjbE family putative metal transport protein [Azospirillum oryzae]QKS49970.1 YjbE family putative metal transport protein [Azospirillum oryzae]GLR82860.1 membrane protein [Azospirillum oryzae]
MDSLIPELIALAQVVFIDLVLAGDNAIVVGMAAAGVARENRARVIFWGIAAAVVLRIGFALAATRLMDIIGLTLAGGLLLLWVCWKLFRELRSQREEAEAAALMGEDGDDAAAPAGGGKAVSTAIWEVIVADVSMSLDNVLAVAGAAREHLWVLAIGLLLSVALMGAAATVIARLLNRFHWIAYLGLAVIVYVAVRMIWQGSMEVMAFAQHVT